MSWVGCSQVFGNQCCQKIIKHVCWFVLVWNMVFYNKIILVNLNHCSNLFMLVNFRFYNIIMLINLKLSNRMVTLIRYKYYNRMFILVNFNHCHRMFIQASFKNILTHMPHKNVLLVRTCIHDNSRPRQSCWNHLENALWCCLKYTFATCVGIRQKLLVLFDCYILLHLPTDCHSFPQPPLILLPFFSVIWVMHFEVQICTR